jgi:uncharacterized coiled-coil protein SlyX
MEKNMSDMLSDINKYAKIWDAALEKGIFKDAPKPAQPRNRDAEDAFGTDFFGQNLSGEYSPDEALNEVDTKYWARVSKMADPMGKNFDPLADLNEETVPDKDHIKRVTNTVANLHNPVYPQSIGKDNDVVVTQNWGTGGKEHFQLEELKVRLEKLESKLNAIEAKGDSGKDTQSKIDSLKKQIDDLSDSLTGGRFDSDG